MARHAGRGKTVRSWSGQPTRPQRRVTYECNATVDSGVPGRIRATSGQLGRWLPSSHLELDVDGLSQIHRWCCHEVYIPSGIVGAEIAVRRLRVVKRFHRRTQATPGCMQEKTAARRKPSNIRNGTNRIVSERDGGIEGSLIRTQVSAGRGDQAEATPAQLKSAPRVDLAVANTRIQLPVERTGLLKVGDPSGVELGSHCSWFSMIYIMMRPPYSLQLNLLPAGVSRALADRPLYNQALRRSDRVMCQAER